MRVLILATDVFTRGGIARYTSTLATALGRRIGRENVDVLSFFSWGQAEGEADEFEFLGSVCDGHRAGIFAQLRFLLKALGLGRKNYDLVIANHVALAPVAAMIKLAYGTPYWVACHSIEVWWGVSRVRGAALRHADFVLAISRYTADVVEKMIGVRPARMKILYNAVPDEFLTLLRTRQRPSETLAELKNGEGVLLSVGSLGPGNEFKGVDTVIRALPKILKANPELRYVVVGDGELRAKLARLAAETGVAKNMIFPGEVNDSELAALYRRCDVFVLPSRGQERNGEVGGEGFGRVYVEAALAGSPVVASRTGGAAEAVLDGRTGFLVNPVSSDEVANAVIAILQDAQLAARMSFEGQKWASEMFSEKALVNSLGELLRTVGFTGEMNSSEECVENAQMNASAR